MKIAYFDFDGTIVRTNSLHYLLALRAYKVRKDPTLSSCLLWALMWLAMPIIVFLHYVAERPRDVLTYWLYRGLTLSDIREGCDGYWRKKGQAAFHEPVLSLLADAYARHYRVVIVSGSFEAVIESALRYVGLERMIDAFITTTFHINSDSVVSGALRGGPNIQTAKVTRVKVYEASLKAEPSTRLAVSDSSSDLPLLLYCDKVCVIKPKRGLRKQAVRRGWTILNGEPDRAGATAEPFHTYPGLL